MITNKEKQFDCIKMKNEIQAKVYAETKNMSKDELLRYFNDRARCQSPQMPGVARRANSNTSVS